MKTISACLRALALAALLPAAAAQATAPAADESALLPIEGVVRSFSQQDGGLRIQLRLDMLRHHSPFPTISYRVPDRALVAGFKPGDKVTFKARPQDGEPTLIAIERR